MKLDHVNLVVSDMERSVAFYTRLGLQPSMDTLISGAWIANLVGLQAQDLKARVVFMEPGAGDARLELIQYLTPIGRGAPENSRPNTIGVRHFAMVVDDLQETYRDLSGSGVTFFSTPQEVTG